MKKKELIQGYGGGGGKGGGGSAHVPTESPDSLRSTAYAQIVDLLSEGEISGLTNGLQSVYLDGTPIQNADGSLNFSGVSIDYRTGTQTQAYLPGFSAVENEISVGIDVTFYASIVRTVTNQNVNSVRLRISTPNLSYINPNTGDISGSTVQFAIDVQTNGGGYVTRIQDSIAGKTSNKYERQYTVPLSGTGPWDIRLRRITPDATVSNLNNKLHFESYTEIVEAKLSYPNSAVIGLRVDASQFQAIPQRAYDVRLLKVLIPSNYDPVARTYSGAWDGTFKVDWSNNPAWCFYDLVTNKRYGLGKYLQASQVDKWALYTIAQYCDQLVPDGFGGWEPRFTMNVYLQTRAEAYKVLQDLAAAFRSMLYWVNGSLTAVQDAPTDPVMLYTAANVIDGRFTYQGASLRARHTVAHVTYNDPRDLFRQKVEYVEDPVGISQWGVIPAEVTAIGCTSRGQAHRLGLWLLYSERLESETVTFRTGLQGAVARPGQVISIADPNRAGTRLGGRISASVASTVNGITLDSPVTLAAGVAYTLTVMMPDGTVQSSTVTTGAGSVSALAVSPPFTQAPAAQAIWVLSSSQVQAQTFRVLSAVEAERNIFEITAVAHNPSKYASIEQGLQLQRYSVSSLSVTPPAPKNVTVTESLYLDRALVKTMINVSWDVAQGATRYQVSYQKDSDNWVLLPDVASNNREIDDVQPGYYTVRVVAISPLGVKSVYAQAQKQIFGKTHAPADIANFNVNPNNNQAQLTWTLPSDLDVQVGGLVLVRYSPLMTGATWLNGVDVGQFPGNSTGGAVPLMAGTYMVKAQTSSGNYSTDAAFASTDQPNLLTMNLVATTQQDPAFAGARTGITNQGGILRLDSEKTIATMPGNVSTWPKISALGGYQAAGSYSFSAPVDLGAVYTSRVVAAVHATAFDSGDTIIQRQGNVSTWQSVVGANINDATVKLYVSTTTNDPNGANPNWGPWIPFSVGDYTARAFQFRLDFASGTPTHNIQVTGLSVTVNVPDHMDGATGVAVPAAGLQVNYSKQFKIIPAISITAENMGSGDYYTITNKTNNGFMIQFFNSAGVAAARTINWLVKGY